MESNSYMKELWTAPVEINMDNGSVLVEENTTTNASALAEDIFEVLWQWDDAAYIMCTVFMVFTMQTGFALLESGAVSQKNEVNMMMKNVVDVLCGGVTYWAFGYGLSFGEDSGTNPFLGVGSFFVSSEGMISGRVYATFFFQVSFASTCTTIVSGAIAERTNFNAYIAFSLLNTFVYCVPAGWLWGDHGFLRNLDVVDMAGSGGVHLVGGAGAVVAAIFIGPRLGRWEVKDPPMGSATGSLIGVFMLWFAWVVFNTGCTFGASGKKWILMTKAACTTLIASVSGGVVGFLYSLVIKKGKTDVMTVITGILSSLVSINGCCTLVSIRESALIGSIGSLLANISVFLVKKLRIDDPVNAVSIHGTTGVWGMIAVGLFAKQDNLEGYTTYNGLFHGGGWHLLGLQIFACVCLSAWSTLLTAAILFSINLVIPVRVAEHEELIGADYCQHRVHHPGHNVSRAVSVAKGLDEAVEEGHDYVGENKGHAGHLEKTYAKFWAKKTNKVKPDKPIKKGSQSPSLTAMPSITVNGPSPVPWM